MSAPATSWPAKFLAAGDREAGGRVAGLRRPSISARVANQLAHAAPDAMAEPLDAGAALQAAQQASLAGQPDAAPRLADHQCAPAGGDHPADPARQTLLVRAGHAASDATLTQLAATLQAATTGDAATRAALAAGRLAGDLDPAGFGLPAAVTSEPAGDTEPAVASPPPAPASARMTEKRARARQAALRVLERTRRAAEQAQAALVQAHAAAGRQQQAAVVAHQHAQQLADRLQELQESADRAAAAAADAKQQAQAAEQDAAAAVERLAVAEEAASAAEQAHAAAQAGLEELEEADPSRQRR